ncbi:MAG: type II secretion system F family protein, partial [bacterium]|nr:type II secretion system F family protein [bacterium]
MPQYSYLIADDQGKTKGGTLVAPSKEAAVKKAGKDGQVVSLQELKTKRKWYEWSSGLRQKDIPLITKRIGDMTEHGFTVIDALKTIELQTQNQTLKDVVQDIKNKTEQGSTLADSLTNYPQYFSTVYTSIIKVGEESGTLSKSLKYLEKQEAQSYALKQKVVSAMTYPAIIVGLMIVIGVGMIIFLIPFLRTLFGKLKAELPLPTQILLGTEEFLRTYWWAILIAMILSFASLRLLFRKEGFRRFWDGLILHIPIFGSLAKSYNAAQIIRTFATLNQTSIPLIEALDILTTVPKNSQYRKALVQIRNDVEKGEIFSAATAKHPQLFSPLIIESIKLGENAGNLTDSLSYLAKLFEDDV